MEILALGQREVIGRVLLRCQDVPGEPWYCLHCLADLPSLPWAQGLHRCGEPTPQPGDLIWYRGAVPPGHGRLYEVTRARAALLDPWDGFQGLRRAPTTEAVIVSRRSHPASEDRLDELVAAGKHDSEGPPSPATSPRRCSWDD